MRPQVFTIKRERFCELPSSSLTLLPKRSSWGPHTIYIHTLYYIYTYALRRIAAAGKSTSRTRIRLGHRASTSGPAEKVGWPFDSIKYRRLLLYPYVFGSTTHFNFACRVGLKLYYAVYYITYIHIYLYANLYTDTYVDM